ncbi:riboflavin kinase [Cadophora gregata]|uniref:riboflavin kinase n=1 Tax=Cadophora gregata TaxID=51156 RepID=UPI0026DC8E5C|nr:riboflavin kinase [Cadophora gregata]KAK0120192.1 riboflavin kinase [Cadophora gregata]KAK0121224.1 riboflavin kinase [Cadophora gregata f. sp. sojae]
MADKQEEAPKADGRAARPDIIGADSGPEPPFPLRMSGKVVSGFGRGSKELGIPTANIPVDTTPWISTAESGVYFGWASLLLPPSHPSLTSDISSTIPSQPSTTFTSASNTPIPTLSPPPSALAKGWRLYPMVMSIGFNPFYKNTVRSAEVHVMHRFEADFYGCEMRLVLLGFIRKELDYVSLEALVGDIRMDIEVAGRSLGRERWRAEGEGRWLWGEEEEV